jgi:hypothetical protein
MLRSKLEQEPRPANAFTFALVGFWYPERNSAVTEVEIWRTLVILMLAVIIIMGVWGVRQEQKLYRATELNRLRYSKWMSYPVFVNAATGEIRCANYKCHTLTGYLQLPPGRHKLEDIVAAIRTHAEQHPTDA